MGSDSGIILVVDSGGFICGLECVWVTSGPE